MVLIHMVVEVSSWPLKSGQICRNALQQILLSSMHMLGSTAAARPSRAVIVASCCSCAGGRGAEYRGEQGGGGQFKPRSSFPDTCASLVFLKSCKFLK